MKRINLNLEFLFFCLAFLLALVLRFVSLGSLPLNDSEAALALQSLSLAQGDRIQIGPQPGYILLTTLVFFVSRAAEFSSRFWPALVGSIIVWAPFLFRRSFGRLPAIILAFAFAIDPALLAASRQADGSVFAYTFSLLAAGFLWNRNAAFAGICAGFALLGGPVLWGAVLPVGVVVAWRSIFPPRKTEEGEYTPAPYPNWSNFPWRRFGLFTVGTLFFAGSLFFFAPGGLSAWVSSLTTYISGWGRSLGVSPQLLLTSLLVYETFPLIFGLLGLFVSWVRRDDMGIFFSRLFVAALVLAVLYPSRAVIHLAWVAIPLWVLAVRLLPETIRAFHSDPVVISGLTILVIIPLVVICISFVNLANVAVPGVDSQNRLFVIIGALVLLAAITILVGWGWGARHAVAGLSAGVVLFLFFYTIGAGWNAAGRGPNPASEIWWSSPAVAQSALLVDTVQNISEWNAVSRDALDLTVVGVATPSMRWALRDYGNVSFVDVLPAGGTPSMLVTVPTDNLQLGADYTGQDFTWQSQPAWQILLGSEWSRWVALRKVPMQRQDIVLWVRADLFPGADLQAGAGQ